MYNAIFAFFLFKLSISLWGLCLKGNISVYKNSLLSQKVSLGSLSTFGGVL